MSSVTAVISETKPTIGPTESECGGTEVARPGANTEGDDSEPPTPKRSAQVLPKLIKEEEVEEDDPLTYLTELFGLTTLDDSEDSDSEDEGSAPSSPRSKGFEKFYFYAASGQIHYYDNHRNVFRKDGGVMVHNGSFEFPMDDLFRPNFHLDGVPYWFDCEGLLSNGVDGTPYRIITWQEEPELLDLCQYPGQVPSSQAETIMFQPNPDTTQYTSWSVEATQMPMPATNESYGPPKSKTEVLTPNASPNPLQQTLKGTKPIMWSPTSSTLFSPIVAGASHESSPEPPLFLETPTRAIGGIPMVSKWRDELLQAQQDAAKARPTKKPSKNKEERRHCLICNKTFRRPSSLEDHLNVHSGEKPHICPFKGCNTGFATKSNMKRHFLTHRVGQLEHYHPGRTPQVDVSQETGPIKSGKISRPTSTYNSKSYHNGRFRIAA